MGDPAGYPATRYESPPMVDLRDRAERARLSQSAARAFLNIMQRWSVRDEDARVLLGGMSNGAYYALKKTPNRTLDTDTLLRVSYLIGIFKALNIAYSKKLADAWIRLPNRNRIFGGRTPLDYMLGGGLPAMQVVRRLVEARAGGR